MHSLLLGCHCYKCRRQPQPARSSSIPSLLLLLLQRRRLRKERGAALTLAAALVSSQWRPPASSERRLLLLSRPPWHRALGSETGRPTGRPAFRRLPKFTLVRARGKKPGSSSTSAAPGTGVGGGEAGAASSRPLDAPPLIPSHEALLNFFLYSGMEAGLKCAWKRP